MKRVGIHEDDYAPPAPNGLNFPAVEVTDQRLMAEARHRLEFGVATTQWITRPAIERKFVRLIMDDSHGRGV